MLGFVAFVSVESEIVIIIIKQAEKNVNYFTIHITTHIMSSKMLQAQFQRNVKHFSVIAAKSICGVHFGVEAILYFNERKKWENDDRNEYDILSILNRCKSENGFCHRRGFVNCIE